jgi:hypothetical protein
MTSTSSTKFCQRPVRSRHHRVLHPGRFAVTWAIFGCWAERSSATSTTTPLLRKKTAEQLLRHAVYDDGGPLIYNGPEEDQRSLDGTCRKLHRFLTQSQR